MEAVNTPKMSVNSHQTTRYNIPEDHQIKTRSRENLKSN